MDEALELRFTLREFDELTQSGRQRIADGVRRLELAERMQQQNRRRGTSVRHGLSAGALQDWTQAPEVRAARDRIAGEWGIAPRHEHTFYLDAPIGTRALTAAGAGAGLELVEVAHTLRVQEQHDTAAQALGLMTTVTAAGAAGNQLIGRIETLPQTVILATETSTITDATPEAGQSIATPHNLTNFHQWSGQFVLQSPAGAAAATRHHAAGIRNGTLQQIIEGSGSAGQIEGLLNIADVPTQDGGTLTWAMVAAAIADVETNGSGQNLAWIVSASAAEIMRQRASISGGAAILADNHIGGYPAYITGCTSSAVAVFGAWADLLVYQFSPLEIGADPYGINSANFRARLVSVRAWLSVDAVPLLAGSFSTLHSIT